MEYKMPDKCAKPGDTIEICYVGSRFLRRESAMYMSTTALVIEWPPEAGKQCVKVGEICCLRHDSTRSFYADHQYKIIKKRETQQAAQSRISVDESLKRQRDDNLLGYKMANEHAKPGDLIVVTSYNADKEKTMEVIEWLDELGVQNMDNGEVCCVPIGTSCNDTSERRYYTRDIYKIVKRTGNKQAAQPETRVDEPSKNIRDDIFRSIFG